MLGLYLLFQNNFLRMASPYQNRQEFNTCHKLYFLIAYFGWYIKCVRQIFLEDLFQNIVETSLITQNTSRGDYLSQFSIYI